MRIVVVASLCIALAACATAEPYPNARPLSQPSIDVLGPTRLSVTGSELGVAKSWYYTQVNGAGAGLIGVVAGAIAAVIINAGPSARAQRQANEVAEVQSAEALNASLVGKFREAGAAASAPGVKVEDVVLTHKSVQKADLDDIVEVSTSYTLSEDSSVLRIVSLVTYANKTAPYKTPYAFKKSVPRAETSGPLYRNTFTYYSTALPVPTLTPELRERLIENIRDSFRTEGGALPEEKSDEFKAMQSEIEKAGDGKLTPTELSVFLTREWLKDGGAKLKQEVDRAHSFIARYAILDINRTAIPSVGGEDVLLETTADDRTVRRVGKGPAAGSYVSSAANVSDFATYGNTVAVAKTTRDYVKTLKDR